MNDTFMKEKPVFPLLLSMALPMVLSMMVNSLYNIVDSFFVAKISEDAMTALSLVYPVQNFISATAIGFGVGINARISFHLGAGERKNADRAATQGVLFSVLHGVLAMVIGSAVIPGFLQRFTTDASIVSLGVTYARTVFSFSIVVMLDLAFEKMFQAIGNMKITMVALIVGALTNIALDPLLIWGVGPLPGFGITGAAVATCIGQLTTLIVYLVTYLTREMPVRLRRTELRPDRRTTAQLYSIGIPAILNLALPSLLVSCLNALLASFAQSYVVVLGIYYKLQTFLYLPAGGIVQGMRPLVSYNQGAGEHRRVKQIFGYSLALTAGIMLTGTLIGELAAAPIMGLFTAQPETITAGALALRLISIGFLPSALSVVTSGTLEALGKGVPSLLISLVRYTVVLLPLAFVLCAVMGPSGVWHAFWMTEVVACLLSLILCKTSCFR